MSPHAAPSRHVGRLIAVSALLVAAGAATPAAAQSTRTECSEKYQAAKAANSLNGLTWPQFYSQCAAQARSEAPAAPASPPAPAAPKPAASKPASPRPTAAGPAVFPSSVAAAYANEKPGRARMKTCLDQYNANKATDGNGGLRWIQKGGGYYSQCNARLKPAG